MTGTPPKPRHTVPALAWFVGARRDVLSDCPSEIKFYNALGLAVLLTGCTSGVALVLVLSYILRVPALHLWWAAAAWSVVIVNLDRLWVMTMTRSRFILAVIPRVLFCLVLGVQFAEPVVLRIFQPEILAQVQTNVRQASQQAFNSVANFYAPRITADQQSITSLQAQEDQLAAQIAHDKFISNCEAGEQACSLTHELGCGPVCHYYSQLAISTQAELDTIKPRDDSQITGLQAQVRQLTADETKQQATDVSAVTSSTGLIAREDALSQITRVHPGITYIAWFIRAALILLDLMPLVLKAMHILSGSAYEEIAAAKRRREALKAHEIDLGTRTAKERLEDQERANREVNRVEINFDRDRRIAEADAAWTDPAHGYETRRPYSSSGAGLIGSLGLDDFVRGMPGKGTHESMRIPLPGALALAGWVGTALIVALATGLGVYTIRSGGMVNSEWIVFLATAAALSLTVFTKGFHRAPAWALRASFAVLLAGLALPFLIAGTNL